ncbi:MAG: hypothetical protein LUC17_01270 [Oscillospiraceae bacterium]|nr:hypothetical protein [Oscillospiraceae bacterium]
MKKQPWINFILAGTDITSFGFLIPSTFTKLSLSSAEITSATSFTLYCTIGGDYRKQVNVAAFEALLYSAAQASYTDNDCSGIPVSFAFGWLDEYGNVEEYVSYTGFTLTFKVSTTGQFMNYEIEGYATLSLQTSMPVLNIPAITGIVQPSAVVEAVAKAAKADTYYQLDIDHNDAPTLVSHGAMTTSFSKYVRGDYSADDDYEDFPGLLALSKSYNSSREAAGIIYPYTSLSTIMNNVSVTPVENFLTQSNVDTTPQCSSFSYWVEEPTMSNMGVIHYKSDAGLSTNQLQDTLEFGTSGTNIISISGNYNGVAYNMSNMNLSSIGFSVDGTGNTVVDANHLVNSWSSSVADVYQTANIINDVNAIASQFSGDFTITMPGTCKIFQIAQPVSLLVLSGNSINPITGIYNIIQVSHEITNQFITTLKIQRLVSSSANQVASGQGIYVNGSSNYGLSSYTQTNNVISTGKVELGTLYPNFENMTSLV